MNKLKMANLLLLSTCILNANEIVTLNDENLSKSRKDDSFHMALEIGTKADMWNPGLSGTALDYDTEGLKLGYATLKVKLYDTDVVTLEKFNTLESSANQNALLEEYNKDRKGSSSLDGLRASIHFMKIINKLTGKEFLNGLSYTYTTQNFIGNATLNEDAKYWYGNAPTGYEGIDFTSHVEGDVLSFKTKFEEHQLLYNGDYSDENNSQIAYMGYFNSKWERPTSFSNLPATDGTALIFPATYKTEGLVIGGRSMPKKSGMGYEAYLKFGWVDNVELAKDSDLESLGLVRDSDKLNMNAYGIKLFYKIADIYSNQHMNVDFLIGGEYFNTRVYKEQETFLGYGEKYKDIDEEQIYGINASLEFTF